MPDFHFLGFLPYRTDIIEADLDGIPPFEKDKETLEIVTEMLKDLML
jgi:CO dehydrogenase maturation factor